MRQLLRLFNRPSHMACTRSYSKEILFSGIQPTGVPHLGNYLGAVRNWVTLQERYEQCIFSVVDLHSLTNPAPAELRRSEIMDTAVTLLACGIDPERCILFQQSDVKEHAELCWILTCMTTEARLKQIPQWKEKAKKMKTFSFGLIAYPVLMAADIMLYRASHIPVGADQSQNMEFCRDLASLFNVTYNNDFFPKCDWLLSEFPKINSLRDPSSKMSKSDKSTKSKITLDDPDDVIRKNIRTAVTDFTSEVYYSPEDRPGVSNLMNIHSAFSGWSHEEIRVKASGMDTGQYKGVVADTVCEALQPIRTRITELRKEPEYVRSVLASGAERARNIALNNLDEIKRLIGLKI